ncbi:DinB family protein [Chitinophaga pendula]|uniref:DinB family protein n=1 Tax=Chitinophaga TaxID=79328 RepID=UPI000BAEB7BF|nr:MULTISPECIES: DinB family protein [Chitinophaga]ASZ13215.1 hypothetical protein CK934_20745 [Chitinophaga sp. MD30]UCJ09165.1 DinB family protein [Chitinophaga pendula]
MSLHSKTLADSLQQLYNGDPWISVNFHDHLSRMNATQATKRLGDSHCVWELINHLIYWHQEVMRYLNNERLQQDGDLPDFYLPENHGEENWQASLHRFKHSCEEMLAVIRDYPEERLYEAVPGTEQAVIYYLQGVIEHAAYHLGQIVLLHKYSEVAQ